MLIIVAMLAMSVPITGLMAPAGISDAGSYSGLSSLDGYGSAGAPPVRLLTDYPDEPENPDEPDNPGYVAVTGIVGVPTAATPWTTLKLTGTVIPANATYQTIEWSIFDGRGTGVYFVSSDTVYLQHGGTLIVRAEVYGEQHSFEYFQDFRITVADIVYVTGITDLPTTAIVGTPLTLSGTVLPADATLKKRGQQTVGYGTPVENHTPSKKKFNLGKDMYAEDSV